MYVCISVCISMCICVAFSQLTLEDLDSVSELGHGDSSAAARQRPRLPMSYSSWLNQFNTNPYGASNVGQPAASNLGHVIPMQSSSYRSHTGVESSVYAPPPPYNVVTSAGGARIVLPTGCGSCKEMPLSGRSHSGLSLSVCLCLCLGLCLSVCLSVGHSQRHPKNYHSLDAVTRVCVSLSRCLCYHLSGVCLGHCQ